MDKADADKAAEHFGLYHVRFFVRHHEDSKKMPIRFCRYWPEVREIRKDNTFGAIIPVGPAKVDGFLDRHRNAYAAYQEQVNLLRDGIVGPFDFQVANDSNRQRPNTIHPGDWKLLEESADKFEVSTNDLNEIIPLRRTR